MPKGKSLSPPQDIFEIYPPEMPEPKNYKIPLPVSGSVMAVSSDPKLWDQLEGESSFAYSGFLMFVNLGPTRTILDANREYRNKPEIVMVDGRFNLWSRKFKWSFRAQAYDAWYRNKNLAQQEDLILSSLTRRTERSASMRDRMFDMAELLIDRAERMLAFPLEEISRASIQDGKTTVVTVKPTKWSIGDIGTLLTQAERMRKLGLGMEEAPALLSAEQIIEQMADAEGLSETQKAQALENLRALSAGPKTGRSSGN